MPPLFSEVLWILIPTVRVGLLNKHIHTYTCEHVHIPTCMYAHMQEQDSIS